MNPAEPTPISGIRYCILPAGSEVTGLERKVRIPGGDLPLPLMEDDYNALEGLDPSYDAVGRGIYHVLRANPDCTFGERYARILRDGYPHFIAEMASQIVMMDKKDLDVAFLDRKINYLKIFALIEPDNARFPQEIGLTFMDKGLRLPALNQATVNLYRAGEFLRKALLLLPADPTIIYQNGEVSYILGKYDDVRSYWSGILSQVGKQEALKIGRRLERIEAGNLPKVPVVDYLAAIGVAFTLHQQEEFAEAAGILFDVLDDAVFREEFPLPEISYVLGLCCTGMGMPRYAEDYFRDALRLNPDYEEARSALANLSS
jgi:tetratricopeptide (TPR) repeat protein